MTLSTKNKYLLLGAIGLIRDLFQKQLIKEDVYNEFMQIIYAEEEEQQIFIDTFVQKFLHKPTKRGRKKIEIQFISECLPVTRDDEMIDRQDDELNWKFIREYFP